MYTIPRYFVATFKCRSNNFIKKQRSGFPPRNAPRFSLRLEAGGQARRLEKAAVLLALSVCLCGCVDISGGGELPYFADTTDNPGSAVFSSPDKTDGGEPEVYPTYTFYKKDEEFLSTCFFIGDSIFLALSGSGVLEPGQVFANEGAKAADGIKTDVLTALVNQNPANVIILLGTNDISVSDKETFCSDYKKLISIIKTYRPDTKITVLSITPVGKEANGYSNEIIDGYNAALKDAVKDLRGSGVRFIDLREELKNAQGELKSKYGRSDGIHLTEAAYYAILWRICKEVY